MILMTIYSNPSRITIFYLTLFYPFLSISYISGGILYVLTAFPMFYYWIGAGNGFLIFAHIVSKAWFIGSVILVMISMYLIFVYIMNRLEQIELKK